MWLVLMLALPADAGTIEAWSRTDFGDAEPMAGIDGWANGYAEDAWWGEGGRALSATDDNTGNSGSDRYGSGWAADNWIIRGDAVGQGLTEVLLFNEDDDTIGLVACANGTDSFYLAAHTENGAPPPVSTDEPLAYLLKVSAGVAEVLGTDRSELRPEDWSRLSLDIDDGRLTMRLNGRVVVEVDDPEPLPPGRSGFYAYDAGYDGGGNNTNAYFDSIEVWWQDADGDLVPDDTDNCEHDKNPGQADHDDDGLGNDCDPDWPPEDTDDPGTEDTGPLDDDVTAGLLCGCATGAPTIPWLLALLAPLVLRRRRS